MQNIEEYLHPRGVNREENFIKTEGSNIRVMVNKASSQTRADENERTSIFINTASDENYCIQDG